LLLEVAAVEEEEPTDTFISSAPHTQHLVVLMMITTIQHVVHARAVLLKCALVMPMTHVTTGIVRHALTMSADTISAMIMTVTIVREVEEPVEEQLSHLLY
jgi:hypothetical protein